MAKQTFGEANKVRVISGQRRRFEATTDELAELERRPFEDHLTPILADLPAETIAKAVAAIKAKHEQEEDARIAQVQKRIDMIRKDGVSIASGHPRWHTTYRG